MLTSAGCPVVPASQPRVGLVLSIRVFIKPCEDQAQRATGSPVISTGISSHFLWVGASPEVKLRPVTPIGVNSVCLQVEKNVRGRWGSFSACGGVGAWRSIWSQTIFCSQHPGMARVAKTVLEDLFALHLRGDHRLPVFHDIIPSGSVPVLTIKAFFVHRFAWLGKWPWCSAN